MLFSILIGAAATLYFFARTLIIKIKVLLSGSAAGAGKHFLPYVIYSEGKQYWNVFKNVADEFEKRQIPLTFLTSSPDDGVFEEQYQFIRAEYIGEGNKAFARLNFLHAGIVLMTTPGLDVYQLKRRKTVRHYSHVLHMTSDPASYRLFGLDYFDSVLLSGSYQERDIRYLETLRKLKPKELAVVGSSYLDVYAEKIQTPLPKDTAGQLTVLVSPSWGAAGILNRYGEKLLDPLAASGYRVIVRPHPQSRISENTLLQRLTQRYRDIENLEWDHERENIASLSRADIMISDFSGIIFDYVFLCNKPVLYTSQDMDLRPYDASDLDHEMWQTVTIRKIGVELKEEDFPRIGEVIDRAIFSAALLQARQKAAEEAWQYRGEAGKRIAGFMISKVQPAADVQEDLTEGSRTADVLTNSLHAGIF
jgi:hypothetical protein